MIEFLKLQYMLFVLNKALLEDAKTDKYVLDIKKYYFVHMYSE